MDKRRIALAMIGLVALAGCGGARPRPGPVGPGPASGLDTPGNHERTMQYQGLSRYYELHVPPGYRKGNPASLVVVFHGGGGNPDPMHMQSGMDAVSDGHGFIVVYPAGTGSRGRRLLTFNTGLCCGYSLEHSIDDVGFTRAVIDDVSSYLSIDAKRVYATGISNGGMMTYTVGCRLADRIAAIAPVAGAMAIGNCSPSRPISVMEFHGRQDHNILWDGGVGPKSASKMNFPPVPEMVGFWVKFDGCPATPKVVRKGAAEGQWWGPCREGTEVVLWSIGDGGHSWPGGKQTIFEKALNLGPVSESLNASEEMWEFFSRHPMR